MSFFQTPTKNFLNDLPDEIDNQYTQIKQIMNNNVLVWAGSPFIQYQTYRELLFPVIVDNQDKMLNNYMFNINLTQEQINKISTDPATWPSAFQTEEASKLDNNYSLKIIQITKGVSVIGSIKEYLPWKELNMLSLALQVDVRHKVRVYETAPHERVIITSTTSPELYIKLISIFPFLFKDLFTFSENTATMLKLIGEDKNEEWAAKYIPWLKNLKLLEAELRKNCTAMLNKTKTKSIRQKEEQLNNLQYDIDSYENAIQQRYKDFCRVDMEIQSLKNAPDADATEFVDYLTSNKCIKYTTTYNASSLNFYIRSPLLYIDQDMATNIYNNQHSDLRVYNTEWMNKLWKACFLDHTHTIYTWTKIRVDFETFEIAARYSDIQVEYPNECYQPHLGLRQCWGDNKSQILNALKKQDFILAIEQIIAATKNLNMYDGVVIRDMLKNWGKYKTTDSKKVILNNETQTWQTIQEWIQEVNNETAQNNG